MMNESMEQELARYEGIVAEVKYKYPVLNPEQKKAANERLNTILERLAVLQLKLENTIERCQYAQHVIKKQTVPGYDEEDELSLAELFR